MSSIADHRPEPAAPGRDDLGIVDALVQLSFLIHGVLARTAATYDLSVVQTRLLGALRDRAPGMNELAQFLGLDKSSVTGLVDRAERRGLLRRSLNEHDHRSFQVGITAQGQELIRKVGTNFEQQMILLVEQLDSEEQGTLSRLASRIVLHDAIRHGIDLFDLVRTEDSTRS